MSIPCPRKRPYHDHETIIGITFYTLSGTANYIYRCCYAKVEVLPVANRRLSFSIFLQSWLHVLCIAGIIVIFAATYITLLFSVGDWVSFFSMPARLG
ncbi:hypothetical protein GGR58DRAFT_496284 [Xylaria digitata]|nr:hypothetical protein GGR58DRAFT_496284 [Xylaria digitata]